MSEQHCGQIVVHMNGQRVEKAVYCADWYGALYCKNKGMLNCTVYSSGRLGDTYSWTDLVIFEGWARVVIKAKRTIIVRHIVESTKRRIGVHDVAGW